MALPVKDEDGKIVACVQFINKLTEDGEASVEGFGACSGLALTPLDLVPSCRRSNSGIRLRSSRGSSMHGPNTRH